MKRNMFSMKRASAVLAAAVMAAASVTGCSSSTDYSMTAGGNKVNAGVYINYILNEMSSQMYQLYYSGEITDMKECLDKEIEGENFKTYVKNKALENTKEFAAVQAKFDELGLTLSEEDVQQIEDSVSSAWSSQEDFYKLEGVSRESLKMCYEHTYKKEAIFDHYYMEGGTEPVSDDDVNKFFADNYIRYKLVTIPKSSNEDEEAAKTENEELKTLWEGYIADAENLDFAGFDEIITKYNDYKEAKTAEESESAEGTDSTADISGDDLNVVTDESAAEESAAETEEAAETTAAAEEAPAEENAESVVEGEVSAAEAGAEESAAEETVETEESAAETEAAAETTAASEEAPAEESTETASAAEESDVTESSADDSTAGETGDESAAEETADGEALTAEEEEEPDPYANETVINFTESTDTTYDYYDENYAALLTEIKNAEVGKVKSYENDKYYYIFVRADVSERTDYVTDHHEDLIHKMKDDEFDGLVKGWIEACSIVVNEKAVKRYTVQEVYDRQEEYAAKQGQ